MTFLDYRSHPTPCEHRETVIVSRADLGEQMYELLKSDSQHIRASYGRNYQGKSAGMTVRGEHTYWLTQHSADPDDITIEQYVKPVKAKKVKKCQK